MRLLPFRDWVLVRSVVFEKSSTLAVVELSADAPDKGEIVAIGPEVPKDKYEIGSIVMFGKYCGVPGDENLHFVRDEDIIALIEDAPLMKKNNSRIDASGSIVAP